MDITFRTASNDDREAVRNLIFGVLDEFDLLAEHEGVDADLEDIGAAYFQRGGVFEIVEASDGAMIGTVGIYPQSGGVCELRKMYLVPSARGKGLGRVMLERALDHARRLGFQRVELETAKVLHRAIDLYRHYGFTEIDPEELCARCDQAFALDL